MIIYFKDKKYKSRKKHKSYKTPTSLSESVDTVAIIGATTTSVTFSVIDVGLIVVPICVEIARALSLGSKVLPKIKLNTYKKYKKQYDKRSKNY